MRALGARLSALGGHPAIVIASAGTVNTGDFDDLEALTALGHRHGAWVHVDGAFGLFAACDPERAHLLRGLSEADSVATDGHKWLNVPYDAGVAFTRHLALQEQVFKAVAAYLGTGPDLLHRTPENSRRFRALPAWMTLMAYGREAHRALVQRCCAIAQAVGRGIEASPDFALMAPVRLNIVCFRLSDGWGGDALATRDRFLSALQADGRILLTPTQLDGRPGLRAAFVNWSTTEDDGETILSALREVAAALKKGGAGRYKPEELLTMLTEAVGKEEDEELLSVADQLIERGLQKGQRKVLLKLLSVRFGALPEAAVARVNAADVAELDLWAERVLTAPTLADVLGDA